MRLLAANLDLAAADRREAAQRKIGNFNSHRKRLRYGLCRKQGYFIGSRIIKMGCMAVIWHPSNSPACSGAMLAQRTSRITASCSTAPTSKPPTGPPPHPRRPPVQCPPLASILILVLHRPPGTRKFHHESYWPSTAGPDSTRPCSTPPALAKLFARASANSARCRQAHQRHVHRD